jgi:trk system potassium uptake protein TrkA
VERTRDRHKDAASIGVGVHVVILGCGRVGSTLARSLTRRDHTVAVIDQDGTAFARLGDDFPGQMVTGIGFDRDTMTEAGIERADAFAAVSSGDNSNIIAARVARETFGVERVVARIYDPKRAEVYERLGIPTVATVRWAADQILQRILPEGASPEWFDASGNVVLAQVLIGQGWIGQPVSLLEKTASVRVACITRYGEGSIPDRKAVLQEGDLVHLLIPRTDVANVETVLASGPDEAA